jgi:hypothetical protein
VLLLNNNTLSFVFRLLSSSQQVSTCEQDEIFLHQRKATAATGHSHTDALTHPVDIHSVNNRIAGGGNGSKQVDSNQQILLLQRFNCSRSVCPPVCLSIRSFSATLSEACLFAGWLVGWLAGRQAGRPTGADHEK